MVELTLGGQCDVVCEDGALDILLEICAAFVVLDLRPAIMS